MKIHFITEIPKSFIDGYVSEELDKTNFKKLPKNITDVWYWYGEGDYCGAGHILAKNNKDIWYHHDCGHCSCYGPTTNLDFSFGGMPLVELYKECSEYLKKELAPLIKAIKEAGFTIR